MKNVVRDKEAKIYSIVDAARTLIETTGYDEVTIRDIAASAGVSVGLIYKYFPGGKYDIIACIGSRYVEEQLVMKQPESIDFNDFPGYVRALIKNMQQFSKLNSSWMKAVATAAARDSEIADEMRKVDLKEYGAVFELFDRFSRR